MDGSSYFDNLIIFSNPVNKILILQFSSPKVSENIEKSKYFYMNNETYEYPLNISIILRSCVSGEVYDDSLASCFACPLNTFSFDTRDKKCLECLPNINCFGGTNVSIDAGFGDLLNYRKMY